MPAPATTDATVALEATDGGRAYVLGVLDRRPAPAPERS
jgi:hypothetical protein